MAGEVVEEFTQSAADELVVNLKEIHGGNVTVMKDGNDIFRVHQPGDHHNAGASVTHIRVNITPNGTFRNPESKSSSFDQSTFDKLRKAANNEDGYSLRTYKDRKKKGR